MSIWTRETVRVCIMSLTRILLIRDKWFETPYWKLPGGGIESIDADIIAAAIREIEEEVGMRLVRAEVAVCSTDWRDEQKIYHPHFCIARVTEEKLDMHLKIGDENGRPLMVATFEKNEVPTMGDLLDQHRPFVKMALTYSDANTARAA
ncbi:MAG: NUDIX domain-containing protein [Candidatus Kaiserbacteria bacterium]|nr:NUDIX domain-containing protein [Candidatus Kaiserbacteria bacterium]